MNKNKKRKAVDKYFRNKIIKWKFEEETKLNLKLATDILVWKMVQVYIPAKPALYTPSLNTNIWRQLENRTSMIRRKHYFFQTWSTRVAL